MKIAFDVGYNDNNVAKAVAIGFHEWTDAKPSAIWRDFIFGLEPYTPGEFYKRELPCIEKVLQQIDRTIIDLVLIDGFVYLDDSGKKGLGAYVYDLLSPQVPVIGVAKSIFANNEKHVRPILRGESSSPLYVSAIGMDLDTAAMLVKSMDGKFRIPTLLSKLDQLTKR